MTKTSPQEMQYATSVRPQRWTAQRKAALVVAVRQGQIDAGAVRRSYGVNEDELAAWILSFDHFGLEGLKVTKTQRLRAEGVARPRALGAASTGGVMDFTPQPRSPSGARAPALSPRQLECLELAAAGETLQQIADRLRISRGTVLRHFANSCEHLEADNLVQAVGKAISLGLIPGTPVA